MTDRERALRDCEVAGRVRFGDRFPGRIPEYDVFRRKNLAVQFCDNCTLHSKEPADLGYAFHEYGIWHPAIRHVHWFEGSFCSVECYAAYYFAKLATPGDSPPRER